MNPVLYLAVVAVLAVLWFGVGRIITIKRIGVDPNQHTKVTPPNYFKGYRRIAMSPERDLKHGDCHSCRNAIAHVTWHCERVKRGCKWEPAYRINELSIHDVKAASNYPAHRMLAVQECCYQDIQEGAS